LRQRQRLEDKLDTLRHACFKEAEKVLAERPVPGFGAEPGAEIARVDGEFPPQGQAAVEHCSVAVADRRGPAVLAQGIERRQDPGESGIDRLTVPGGVVAGCQLDVAVPAVVAAVVQLDGLAAGRELQLAGHRVGDAGQVGQYMPAAPAVIERILITPADSTLRTRRTQRAQKQPGQALTQRNEATEKHDDDRFDGSGREAARLARLNRIARTNVLARNAVRAHDPIRPRASLRDARRTGLLSASSLLCSSV